MNKLNVSDLVKIIDPDDEHYGLITIIETIIIEDNTMPYYGIVTGEKISFYHRDQLQKGHYKWISDDKELTLRNLLKDSNHIILDFKDMDINIHSNINYNENAKYILKSCLDKNCDFKYLIIGGGNPLMSNCIGISEFYEIFDKKLKLSAISSNDIPIYKLI